jgi:hypothetical protein
MTSVGRERRLVDYYEGSGVGLDHYAQVLHDKRILHISDVVSGNEDAAIAKCHSVIDERLGPPRPREK